MEKERGITINTSHVENIEETLDETLDEFLKKVKKVTPSNRTKKDRNPMTHLKPKKKKRK